MTSQWALLLRLRRHPLIIVSLGAGRRYLLPILDIEAAKELLQ
jgi:hypothetical protein